MLWFGMGRTLAGQVAALVETVSSLAASLRSEIQAMSENIDDKIAEVKADVAALAMIDQQIVGRIGDLTSRLSAALAQPNDPQQRLSAIADIHAQLQAEVQKLTAAAATPLAGDQPAGAADGGATEAQAADPGAGSTADAGAEAQAAV